MFTRPKDLTDAQVAATLQTGWGIDADEIAYAAIGFGSHHWRVVGDGQRRFLSVDDLEARRRSASETRGQAQARLAAALGTAHGLRSNGLDFVVAPTPSLSGDLISSVVDRYVLAVYRHIDGEPGEWGRYESRGDRLAVVDRLVAIHASVPDSVTLRDDAWLPSRDALTDSLEHLADPWSAGPFAECTRQLLVEHEQALRDAFERYDVLASRIASDPAGFVTTHGEPHPGNVILTANGPQLIDWDTTLLAPPERDLWALIDEDESVRGAYETRSGRPLNDNALELYRLWWDLCEVCLYVADFRQPHTETADTRRGWDGLQQYLDPTRWH